MYTKEEVDAIIEDLKDDLSDQEQPAAFGTISSGGVIAGGSGNFTVDHYSTGIYIIEINGFLCQVSEDRVDVSLILADPGFISWIVSDFNLYIYIRDVDGDLTDRFFNFSIWRN